MKTLRRIVALLAAFGLLAFGLVVVNQTADAVALADRVDPRLGTAVLWTLLALYAVLLITPAVLYWRLPPPLAPPASEDDPGFEEHLTALRRRMAGNPRLAGASLDGRAGVESALALLDGEAEKAVRDAASLVFLTTAVSQSGRLDAISVLAANARLVWRVAHVYFQRPTLRDMTKLYANVAATSFVAGQLEDIDVSEQIQPVISAAFGGIAGSVPGLRTMSTVLAASTLNGAANAFLTLRVGMVARIYCGALVLQERRALRRSATAAAAGMLGGIVSRGVKTVVRSAASATVGKVGSVFRSSDRVVEPPPAADAEVEPAASRGWLRGWRR